MAKDIKGETIQLGDIVARAISRCGSPYLEVVAVTKLMPDGKPCLNGRSQPVQLSSTTLLILRRCNGELTSF